MMGKHFVILKTMRVSPEDAAKGAINDLSEESLEIVWFSEYKGEKTLGGNEVLCFD